MTLSQPPDTHSERLSFVSHPYRWRGLCIAGMVIATWLFFIAAGLLGLNPGAGHWAADATWILATTFLSTGVFITAHDSMHGLVAPFHPVINRFVGRLSTRLYAGLDYDFLEAAHGLHHRSPATQDDPDYHEGNPHFVPWFVAFMRRYLTIGQLLWMGACFGLMTTVLAIPATQAVLFWALPLVLSTLQLFTVGTWMPHRPGEYRGTGHLKTRSLELHPTLSFLACYHFGYHYEHHARPDIPWWRLWRARQEAQTPTRQVIPTILSSTTSIS